LSASRLKVEVYGLERAPQAPCHEQVVQLCKAAAATAGVRDGHLAIEFVPATKIAELNHRHRRKHGPTDVLSFPIDGLDAQEGVERELGDVVICPEHTIDLREAVVHGVLHLLGMDHETDDGQMLATQARVLADDLEAAIAPRKADDGRVPSAIASPTADDDHVPSAVERAIVANVPGGSA
jgi:probable rRNA maturation factor